MCQNTKQNTRHARHKANSRTDSSVFHAVKRFLRYEMWKELVSKVDTRGAVRESKPAALLFRTVFVSQKTTGCQVGAEATQCKRTLRSKLTVT